MIRIGSTRPTTLPNPADLEELAYLFGADVHLPGNRAGWATCTVNGTTYRAWLPTPSEGRVA